MSRKSYLREDSSGSGRSYPGSYLLSGDDRSSSPARSKSPSRQHSTKEEFIYKEVKELRRRMGDLEAKLAAQPTSSESASPGEICFSAVRTTTLSAGSGGIPVTYERVLCNKGGHFSGATGTFRAPQPGMYLFAVHGENACEPCTFDLTVDNEAVASVTQGGDNWSTSGNVVIVPLASGQSARVFLHQGKMSSYPDKPIASFSGFLVN